ncbi:MAG: hypothetical protein LBT54_03195 [Bifidobacteriaceae bacterium]|jgi:hypothetical protein|nr:hypothetical protein [Bifidobacteriaceae bacterium]
MTHRILPPATPVALLIALLFGVGPAWAAGGEEIPADVAAWFEVQAPVCVGLTGQGADPGAGVLSFPQDAVVGPAAASYSFGNEFIETDNPSSQALVPQDRWTAPILAAGEAVGTISAVRSAEGTLEWVCTDDSNTGIALSRLEDGGRLVADGINGTFRLRGETVLQVNGETGPDGFEATAEDLWEALAEQQVELDALTEPVMGGVRPIALSDRAGKNPAPTTPTVPDVDANESRSGLAPGAVGVGAAAAVALADGGALLHRNPKRAASPPR